MSKADKREQRIRNNPLNVSQEDFEWLISRYGKLEFGGNHALASIENVRFPYKRQNPINFHYVEELFRIIDEQKERWSDGEKS
jgi:hypothetical protein